MGMNVFNALAASTRRDIIELLVKSGELSATDISDRFAVSPSAISQHLKVLREAKLIRMDRRAQQRIYQVDPAGMQQFENWTKRMTGLWNKRLDALDDVLKAEEEK